MGDGTVAIDGIGERLTEGLKGAEAERLVSLGQRYLAHLPKTDLKHGAAAFWVECIRRQMALLRQRGRGEIKVDIYNPPSEEDGSRAPTVVDVISGDRPFLVDSATLAISSCGHAVHRAVHPVYQVQRDAGGYLMGLSVDKQNGDEGWCRESVMQFHISRINDPTRITALKDRIEAHLDDVRVAVADWPAMLAKAREVADYVAAASTPYGKARNEETAEFLRWLVDQNFTFLGYRRYELQQADGGFELIPEEPTGLGVLGQDSRRRAVVQITRLTSRDAKGVSEVSPVVLTKTGVRSTVHRGGYLDYVGVGIFDDEGSLVGEHRFLGLYTSAAYNRRPWNIPLVRKNIEAVMARSLFEPTSHGGKALLHIAETLPRDELFQASTDELHQLVTSVFELSERQQTRLLVRRDRFGRFYSCLVYLPRERFNTETRRLIQDTLRQVLKGERIDFTVQVDESTLARLHVVVWVDPEATLELDLNALEQTLQELVRSWVDRLTDILIDKHGEAEGQKLADRFAGAFPAAYVEDVAPWVAAFDVEKLALLDSDDALQLSLYRPRIQPTGKFRFKIFRLTRTIALSDALPILENLGLRVVSERPYRLQVGERDVRWVQDFDIVLADGGDLDLDGVREIFQDGFEQIVRGQAESDGFNRLILGARLSWRQVALLRAYCRYWQQSRCPYSQSYVERTLAAYPSHAELLLALFAARFDPALDDSGSELLARATARLERPARRLSLLPPDGVEFKAGNREELIALSRDLIQASLARVKSSDEDRIISSFAALIDATLRVNAYQGRLDDPERGYLSFKLDSSGVPDLPPPRPWREIYVYSPEVEGVHLRGGPVSRGGLRWSDRFEDFRTEVLGLMKAQTVKNTMIVPVGAKGGFVARRLPGGAREEIMAAVVSSYRRFINGLLDLTDNIRDGDLVHPENLVRHDDADPYLVVAADKGTATFSDIANSVAEDHGFWLGDAFASGGSVGYDHKKMGITARGAWESVKRHFRELGVNCQKEPFTVVGIGDMGGDVFGNGMLLSRQIRLLGAFNHEHIFLDPDPDPAASYAERERLFNLPRSSWADYDADLISPGGGIYSRSDKQITVSPAAAESLGIKAGDFSPNDLVRAMLRAPVDLLWNGGIGTYVKSAEETNLEVGDRANNELRVDGTDLRCRVVGEGGNLGLTQRGRIEFALDGGRINTDFVDNAAGVDCSDHEVNIKILLRAATDAGLLDSAERNELLASMTDEVAQLVLRNNYLQTQALSLMEAHTVPRLGSKAHMIDVLESRGVLDRGLESLPDAEQINERRARGIGLTRPELAVLLSYAKITLYEDLLASDVPEDGYLSGELVRYFPDPLKERFAAVADTHRLRREIIATAVTNSMVNRMGATFCLRMTEETGTSPAEVARAYTAAREIFEVRELWAAIEATDNEVITAHQTEAHLLVWNLLRHATRWLLSRREALDIAALVAQYREPVRQLAASIRDLIPAASGKRISGLQARLTRGGFSDELVASLVSCALLNPALDIADVAGSIQASLEEVAKGYFRLGQHLKLNWLMQQIELLPVDSEWHAAARGALRDELYQKQRQLTALLIGERQAEADSVRSWVARNSSVQRFMHMMNDMRASGSVDYAKAAVAVRGLDPLLAGARPA
ncbi:MAG: NAD-glutamate dehydrogenase [Pseudomonadota bacterium]